MTDTARVQTSAHLRTVERWASSRAWTRAGAVAQVLAAGTPRRVVALTSRVVLLAAGLVLVAVAVAAMLWNQLGPGPLDVLIGAVRVRTGLPLAVALWATIAVLLAAAWLLGRRPGPGSVIGPIVLGPAMQLALSRFQLIDVPSSITFRVAIQVTAIAVVGIGAGAMIASGLGAGSGELLAAAASDRSGHPEPRMRLAFEATWVILGIALGGPIGIGTVLVAILIGPAVAHGHRLVESTVAGAQRQLRRTPSVMWTVRSQ